MKQLNILLGVLFIAFATSGQAQTKEKYPFENEIAAFKKSDAVQMPPKHGILFIGSSSIRKWSDLEQRFPEKPIIKRGVGGSQLVYFPAYYMNAIVYPYAADKIFVYAGDNDLAHGQTPDDVLNSFKTLWKMIREKQPKAAIYFLSIKYCNSRAKLFDAVREANDKVADFLKNKKNGEYIDVASSLLGADGKPDDSLFASDRLHLNSQGYDRWQKAIQPYIDAAL